VDVHLHSLNVVDILFNAAVKLLIALNMDLKVVLKEKYNLK